MASHTDQSTNLSAGAAANTTQETSAYMTWIHLPAVLVERLVYPATLAPSLLSAGPDDRHAVDRMLIRRLIRTYEQLRRVRARIVQRQGYHGVSFITDVLLRRILAEVARLERRVFDLSEDELNQ
ncbi:hypothetical protein PGTUg99_022642 [Puccinia graminis f. sp. tritici]|uniref:Uncharacterized protein n=2 Tax=Puccinia graminis f. sp. tritici TaxID=56615 RepID=A0A5B0PCK8_PUCGR|nr:hypothetical protein PGTUg99_022642 [Puccinia graminis f. sp. tritici]